ncbi:MAG: copper-binding protein [Sulfuricella sp.]
MKKLLISTLSASLLLAGAALADEGHGQHMKAPEQTGAQSPTFMAVGTVQKIDPANGSVTIAHQAIPALKWPAMTMPFAVGDKELFSRLKTGEKVSFVFKREDGKTVIVSVNAPMY